MNKKRILFVCTGNVCRSAMAEKMTRHFYGDTFDVDSCGVHPMLPFIWMDRPTIEVMAELGIDISSHAPKSIFTVKEAFDLVVNMSFVGNETLRKIAGTNLKNAEWVYWDVVDPRREPMETYLAVRDRIRAKLSELAVSRA